jgi:hypothetical protein
MSQHHSKQMVDPAAWSMFLLLALAMVLALTFTEKATIAGPLRPMNQFCALAPAVVGTQLSGTFEASRKGWSAIRPTTSRLLAPHAPGLDESFARELSVPDAVVRATAADLRHMLSDMADQSRQGYPAFLGPCPCPVREQLGLLATE